MNTDPLPQPEQRMSKALQRRAVLSSVLRSVGVAVIGFTLYFMLPFDAASNFNSGVALLIGLVAMAALTAWQLRAIARSPIPRMRAVEGLLTIVLPFVLLFATTYFLMDQYRTQTFTQQMTRVDSLYFTVTTLATVGFGDITPATEGARLTVTVQMVLDLALIGLIVRAFVSSARTGLARRDLAS